MHFHADHALFFEQHRPLWRVVATAALTLSVLVLNTAANDLWVSLAGSAVGALLLLGAAVRGHRRLQPAFAWTAVLVVVAVLSGVALTGDAGRFAGVAARVACGMIWVLWLGTQVDWASIRQLLLAVRVPEHVVGTLDHALLHGILTKQEWTRRRDAARVRSGKPTLPLSGWGQLLGEGALQAFLRVERVEENALVRSSAAVASISPDDSFLDAVDVERDGRLVLVELELSLPAGEWVLLCGPSGAGKSSLLRLLAGLNAPSKGEMTRLGTRVQPNSPLGARLDGRVALLSQNPQDHFIASTVAEDVMWGLLRRGVEADEARRRAGEMARALRVDHLLERPCHALSFGEQRRVALAGLLVLEPSLLLLDEPTAGLDPVAGHELRTLVEASVRRTGAACVWATHDLHAVPPQAKRVVLLRGGRVLFDGPSDAGLSREWLVRAGLALPGEGERAC